MPQRYQKSHATASHSWCYLPPGRGDIPVRGIIRQKQANTIIYIHPFNGPLSGTTRVSRYQKGKTNLDFTEARDNEWQWHQLGHMQVCTSLQTNNHASTPPLSLLQAGCPSCHPTNSVKGLKALKHYNIWRRNQQSNQGRISPRSPHGAANS